MPPNPYQDIAKEFLDLWQKQMTSVMGDKQFIHAMLELFSNMQGKNNAKSGTAAHTADSSAAQPGLLSEFAFRLAMCEKRLAALEAKPAEKPQRKTGTGNRGRSKKPNK